MQFFFYAYSKTNTIPVFNYVSVNMAPEIRLITSFQTLLEILIKKKLFSKKQVTIVKFLLIRYKVLRSNGLVRSELDKKRYRSLIY